MLAGGDLWYPPPQFSQVSKENNREVFLRQKMSLLMAGSVLLRKKLLILPGYMWFRESDFTNPSVDVEVSQQERQFSLLAQHQDEHETLSGTASKDLRLFYREALGGPLHEKTWITQETTLLS